MFIFPSLRKNSYFSPIAIILLCIQRIRSAWNIKLPRYCQPRLRSTEKRGKKKGGSTRAELSTEKSRIEGECAVARAYRKEKIYKIKRRRRSSREDEEKKIRGSFAVPLHTYCLETGGNTGEHGDGGIRKRKKRKKKLNVEIDTIVAMAKDRFCVENYSNLSFFFCDFVFRSSFHFLEIFFLSTRWWGS